MIFQLGSQESGDYSNRVITGSYNVNSFPVFINTYTDANGVEHRNKIRDRVEGSFDMYFRNMTEYGTFVTLLNSLKQGDTSVACSVAVNNTNATHTGYFFIDFTPTRNRKGDWTDYMELFTVKIKEK